MQLQRTDLAAGLTIVGEHGPVPRNKAPTKGEESPLFDNIILLQRPAARRARTPLRTDGRKYPFLFGQSHFCVSARVFSTKCQMKKLWRSCLE